MQMRAAQRQDAEPIIRLRDEAAAWQKARQIAQWNPGEVSIEALESQIAAGDWWVLDDGAQPGLRAAVRIVETDPLVWEAPADAGYIHGLVISRDEAGLALGARVLAWAEDHIAGRGHTIARLDCVLGNDRLRKYYQDQGYLERGETRFPPTIGWRPVMRFEKLLPKPPEVVVR